MPVGVEVGGVFLSVMNSPSRGIGHQSHSKKGLDQEKLKEGKRSPKKKLLSIRQIPFLRALKILGSQKRENSERKNFDHREPLSRVIDENLNERPAWRRVNRTRESRGSSSA